MPERIVRCRYCRGVREVSAASDGHPWGWYSLSVNVPPEQGKRGQPFVWVGVWCSTSCLAADLPRIQDQALLAQLAYEADPPYPEDSPEARELAAGRKP